MAHKLLTTLVLAAILRLAMPANAADIPTACKDQAPWGAPQWVDGEPQLTPLCRTAYVVLHDNAKLVPDFVSWRLTAAHALGCLPRKDSFKADPDLPSGHRAELGDYKGQVGVYDRGHFAPNSDFSWDADVQSQSFYLSNMSPQASHLNQWEWEVLESTTRAWAVQRKSLIVMDGPIWEETPETIGPDHVAVPTAYWKVVVDPKSSEAIAFIMNNEPTPKGDLQPYDTSVDEVQKRAGLVLPLPSGIDRSEEPAMWAVDMKGFQAKKKKACNPE